MKARRVLAAAFLFAIAGAPRALLAQDDDPLPVRGGWHFYVDPAPPPVMPDLPTAPALATSAPVANPALAAFEDTQKQLQVLRNIAIMIPSAENVQRYLEFEKSVVDRAAAFADMAQRVAWRVPGLDPASRGRPVGFVGQQAFDLQQREQRAARVQALSRDHALLFAFRSDCPFCHAFAPVLHGFSQRYGMRVVPVSLDGPGIPEFPQPRSGMHLAQSLGITQVPALFLLNPYAGTVMPVGVGVLSEPELLERIAALADGAGPPATVAAITPGRNP